MERKPDRNTSRSRAPGRAGAVALVVLTCTAMSSCKGEKPGPPSRESSGPANPAFHRDVRPGSPISPGSARLGKFVVAEAVQGWGKPQLNLSVTGNPLSIGGRTYASGLGTHAVSRIGITFEPRFKVFSGRCGVDDWVGAGGSVIFKIEGDGKTLFTSPLMKGGVPAAGFAVSVQGLSGLILLVESGGGGINGDHADWVNLELK